MSVREFVALLASMNLVVTLAGCGDDDSANATSTTTSASSAGGSGPTSSGSAGSGNEGGDGGTGATGGSGGSGGGTGGTPPCLETVPDTYDGAAYDQNAAADLLLRTQMKVLQDPMKAAEADVMVVPVLADLQAAYDEGSPSLLDLTTAYYAPKVDAALVDFVAAAGNAWTPTEPPSGPGGIFGTHIYSATGTDLRQLTEKGLYNAALYNHAITIAGGTLDEAAIDRLVAVFGAHPSFPGDSAAMTNPDVFMAVYAERRSPKDPNDASKPLDPADPGPYFRIKRALITAKAAIAAGCDVERDDAIAAFLLDWEITNAGTIIFYLNDAAKKLTIANPTTADLDGGLHGYGEAIAFLHSMRTVAAPGKIITDAQIDQVLADLGSPHDAPATAYKLLTDTAAEVPKLQAAIATLAGIYGLSQAQVEAFFINH